MMRDEPPGVNDTFPDEYERNPGFDRSGMSESGEPWLPSHCLAVAAVTELLGELVARCPANGAGPGERSWDLVGPG